MSHTIAVELSHRPLVSEVLGGASFPNLRSHQSFDPHGTWPTQAVQLYLDQVSTRATDVRCSAGNRLEITIFPLASTEDCELAFGIAERLAAHNNTTVESEVWGSIAPEDLRSLYHGAWIREQANNATNALVALIDQGHGPIEVPGPVRPFYIGERLLGDLREAGPEHELTDRIMDALRIVQYLPADEYFPAGTFEAHSTETGERIHFAVWGPGRNYVIPAVGLVLVSAPAQDEDVFLIPSDSIADIAPGRCHWLDERQRIVMEFTEAEWPDLMERAREHEVKP